MHDIIDNREEKLSEHIGSLLDNAERAKFAVGYFFLSGFKEIQDHLEKVGELRLLIGSTSNLETIEALALGAGNEEAAAKKLEPLISPFTAEGLSRLDIPVNDETLTVTYTAAAAGKTHTVTIPETDVEIEVLSLGDAKLNIKRT